MKQILFDDALPTLVDLLKSERGNEFVEQGTFLRDADGRLTFFSRHTASQENERTPIEGRGGKAEDNPDFYSIASTPLAQEIIDALGAYARADRPIVYADENNQSPLLDSPDCLPVLVNDVFCQLIDRRIVGAGWLTAPREALLSIPRIVFASLKGGVGRSTALTITAADLARRNLNVLVIDLDLEAPGLGHLLLEGDRAPDYGVIDFLVENGIGGVADDQLNSFVGTSQLTAGGGGRVDVVPAIGRRSVENPENILPKLSRAMLEDVGEDGSISVGQQISGMIDRLTSHGSYDVVLIDSRAGLAELTAPAITGLGATVLLFGTAQTQTIEGYRALFAALRLLAQRDRSRGGSANWRLSLRPVYAKASLNSDKAQQFRYDFFDLYSEYLYDAELPEVIERTNSSASGLRFNREDTVAPHWPLMIPFSPAFVDFDPTREADQLTTQFYQQSFGPFLNAIDSILASACEGLAL